VDGHPNRLIAVRGFPGDAVTQLPPTRVVIDRCGNVHVVDLGHNRVVKVAAV
jgi:hypothetical protein